MAYRRPRRRRRPAYRRRRNAFRRGRRAYRRRYNKSMSSFSTPMYSAIAPRMTVKRLLYREQFALTVPTSGNVITSPYRANSCYDPDASIGGHQPLGFDAMMNLYRVGTVLASAITVRFQRASFNHPGQQFTCGIEAPNSGQNTLTDTYMGLGTMENPFVRYKPLPTTADYHAGTYVSHGVNVKKRSGRKDLADDTGFLFTSSADLGTAYTYFYLPFVRTSDDSVLAASGEAFHCLLSIAYIVRFSEPLDLSS